ncbi:hypothetical protein [Streptomyces sp. NPDC093111]|uniref:hypothetical protein n=1 Tax=Streptomyces sp. NPDC093111 TaxID=3154978 RepID=UPI00342D6E69
MADERYQWLDQEAAERLLRGEPVDPADDAARAHARLLARALESARTPLAVPGPDGELPGEAAALAAFRKDTAERAAAATAARFAPATGPAAPELGTLRIAPAPSGHRWGRSLRYGLAAALAAVTVGGVAVAAGTGMLPLTGEPAPARSVSAAGTPEGSSATGPAVLGSPTGGAGSAIPSVPLDRESGTATPGATGGPATATAGPDGGSPSPGRTTGGRSEDEDSERRKTLKACREFQQGKLADSGRQRLLGALKNGETVKRYCTRVLSGAPATGTTPSGDGGNGGSGNGGDTNGGSGSDGDDNGDRGGDKHHPDAPGKPGGKPGTKPGGKPGAKPGGDGNGNGNAHGDGDGKSDERGDGKPGRHG